MTMKNKISVFSLQFFFIYAVRTGWTPILKILVILNSALVLLQTALQYKEVLHNARKWVYLCYPIRPEVR